MAFFRFSSNNTSHEQVRFSKEKYPFGQVWSLNLIRFIFKCFYNYLGNNFVDRSSLEKIGSLLKFLSKNHITEFKTIHLDITFSWILKFQKFILNTFIFKTFYEKYKTEFKTIHFDIDSKEISVLYFSTAP